MTLDQMMARMGFVVTDQGPYVSELRALVAKQMSEGMVNRSAGTWADECYERDERGFIIGWKISAEDRAKALLEMGWAIANGHAYEVKHIDDKNHIGDRAREVAMDIRIWLDKLLGRKNPYSAS